MNLTENDSIIFSNEILSFLIFYLFFYGFQYIIAPIFEPRKVHI